MNKVYIYQDSFESLLILVETLRKQSIKPYKIKKSNYEGSLLEDIINLKLDNQLDIIKLIKSKLGNNILRIIYDVYISDDENKELIIYYFYLNAWKYPQNILIRRDLKCVVLALKIQKKVRSEVHKLKGFLRFRELDNKVLYAKYKASCDALRLLANHFKERLAYEYWIIHDEKRNKMAIYDKKNYYIINSNNIVLSKAQDGIYESLWKEFFKTIKIKERENKKCQRNFMPKKYWDNMLEMEDER